MSGYVRHIYKRRSSDALNDLLQAMFTAEFLTPSKCLWVVSPWISDVALIDNRANSFQAIDPSWGCSWVRFSQVLTRLGQNGTAIVVATRPDAHNESFLRKLQEVARPGFASPPNIHRAKELHSKGILGDHFYLSGSMNFTLSGVLFNEEAVQYCTDSSTIAEAKLEFTSRWGQGKK